MSLREALEDPDAVVVALGPAGRPGAFLQVRVSQDASVEFGALLREEGIHAGVVIQESAEIQQLTPFIASIAGGLGGLAAVLRTWFRRHQDRSIAFTYDGNEYELKGMSEADMEALIMQILSSSESAQQERESLYRDIPPDLLPGE